MHHKNFRHTMLLRKNNTTLYQGLTSTILFPSFNWNSSTQIWLCTQVPLLVVFGELYAKLGIRSGPAAWKEST